MFSNLSKISFFFSFLFLLSFLSLFSSPSWAGPTDDQKPNPAMNQPAGAPGQPIISPQGTDESEEEEEGEAAMDGEGEEAAADETGSESAEDE